MNTRDQQTVALAYSPNSLWRNRDALVTGRAEIIGFLTGKWRREQGHALRKGLWCFHGNRVRGHIRR